MDIYTNQVWTALTAYNKNDFVSNGGLTYYSKDRHVSAGSFATDLTNGRWDGQIIMNGESKPYFWWKSSYNYNFNIKPVVRAISYGDGYSQTAGDGINNILLPFDVQFEDRDLAEYTAILKFLDERAGYQKFYFVPPAPFNILKLFICSEWNPTQTFYDKYSISCKFQEKI